jgi:hypothetical protein
MAIFRGILHVHSTYSDGEYTLPELRRVLAAEGYRFACLADHAEHLVEPGKVEAYRRACAELSDAEFLLVPGLEYECDRRLHVVGFGSLAAAGTTDPERVIAFLRRERRLSVIAHPPDDQMEWIASFAELPDGVETWNSKYDSPYAPRPSAFDLLSRLRRRSPSMKAFFGVDLHFRHQDRALHCEVDAAALEPEAVLEALAAGRYTARQRDLRLSPDGAVDPEQLARFRRASARYFAFRGLARGVKRGLDRLGLRLPAALKSQLRRIF